ncbi:hypothetical protein [Actinopolyspora mortivallis]|uniref:hypothetical protein n=1 Tax=Actinopolyspora mortivallis TaxID=33906 RepID=UPI0011B1F0D4|nr:hypothetical protein [Actinopolyspora mortivallis]
MISGLRTAGESGIESSRKVSEADKVATDRRAFLEAIDNDLSKSNSGVGKFACNTGFLQKKNANPLRRRVGSLVALTLAAAASFMTQTAVAQAETVTETSARDCLNPRPIPKTQTFYCGTAQYVYDFKRGPVTINGRECYIFQLEAFLVGCGSYQDLGEKTICK